MLPYSKGAALVVKTLKSLEDAQQTIVPVGDLGNKGGAGIGQVEDAASLGLDADLLRVHARLAPAGIMPRGCWTERARSPIGERFL